MKPTAVSHRALARALAAAATLTAAALATGAPARAADPVAATLDRTAEAAPAPVAPATERARAQLRRSLGGRALLQSDRATGTPRIVARLDGFLTPPSDRRPVDVALGYVRAHADAFGLDAGDLRTLLLTARERGPDGTVHLTWEQRAGGLPLVDGGLHAAVTAEGRLLNVRGGTIPDPAAGTPQPAVDAATAYATADPRRRARAGGRIARRHGTHDGVRGRRSRLARPLPRRRGRPPRLARPDPGRQLPPSTTPSWTPAPGGCSGASTASARPA